ncbi:hypothetical protein KJ693_06085 [bacterium]|nr:hypothetical protein [bacterium]MBU1614869.1 hypothetical protein [bacterium]
MATRQRFFKGLVGAVVGSIISRMGEIGVAIGKLDDFKFQWLSPLFLSCQRGE